MQKDAIPMAKQSTRDQIVETADALFYENGFDASSFADIAGAVGISRGNFYHHFKSKDDILDAVIDRRQAATQAMVDDWQAGAETPRARILSYIHIVIRNQAQIMDFGCPVGTLCSELAKLNHAAQPRAAAIFGLFQDWLTDQFRVAGAGARSREYALHVLAWSQGVAVMASAFRDPDFLRREVADITAWLDRLPGLDPNKQED